MLPKTTRLEGLLEAVPDALVGMDREGVIRFVNRQTESLFGYHRDQLIGQPVTILVPKSLLQIYAQHRDDFFADPRTRSLGVDLELSGLKEDGTEFPINISLSHIDTGDVLLVITAVGEVNEQRQAVETAQRMASIIEHSEDAIIGETPDGIITTWNPAAEKMYGYSSQEIVGKSTDLLSPKGHTREIKGILAKVKAGQVVQHREIDRVRKDGTTFPVSLTISPIRDARGVVVGTSTIARDVTERRQLETTLAETSRQYRLLAENASDLVVLTSPDREVTWVSPSLTSTLGWAPEDLMGGVMLDLVHPDDAAANASARDAMYFGHESATPAGGVLMRIRTKSGPYRWMALVANPVTDESGVFMGVVSGLRDVDDLVRAREAAQIDRAALRATLDSLLDPQVRSDAVRDESGQIVDFRYVEANPAACAYLGLDRKYLVGKRMLDLFPGIADDGRLARYGQVVETGEPLVLENVANAQEPKGGQERHLDISTARVGDGLSQTWRDVTDRYAVAKSLAKSEEQYRLLAENASDVVMRLSPDLGFDWVSGSAADVLGWGVAGLLGHRLDSFIHPEDLSRFGQVVDSAAPGSAARMDFRFRRSDGSYRWVACRITAKVDAAGIPVSVVGGLVDVQDRKVSEAKELDRLAELEQFQRLTVGRELKMIELKKEIEYLRRYRPAGGTNPDDQHGAVSSG